MMGRGTSTDRIRFGKAALKTGVTLHYAEVGDGKGEPVIFLHGYADSWFSFERVLQALPSRRRAYALDLRGHGNSDKPGGGYALDDFAGDVVAFMDARKIGRATIAGHSMGASIAQALAARRPERVEGLFLISAAPCAAASQAVRELKSHVDGLNDPVERAFIADFQATDAPVPKEFMETVVTESMKVPARVWKAALEGLIQEDLGPDLPHIEARTFIAWGKRDGVFSLSDQEALLSGISDSVLKEYETGHALHWEKPEEAAADLESFLE